MSVGIPSRATTKPVPASVSARHAPRNLAQLVDEVTEGSPPRVSRRHETSPRQTRTRPAPRGQRVPAREDPDHHVRANAGTRASPGLLTFQTTVKMLPRPRSQPAHDGTRRPAALHRRRPVRLQFDQLGHGEPGSYLGGQAARRRLGLVRAVGLQAQPTCNLWLRIRVAAATVRCATRSCVLARRGRA
jgi:hypothetical protein